MRHIKHINLLFATALSAMIVLTACESDRVQNEFTECDAEFTAVMESFGTETRIATEANTETDAKPVTKTSLESDGRVVWSGGELVTIFNATTINQKYQVSDDSAGKTTANLSQTSGGSGGFYAGSEISANVALYPYSPSADVQQSGADFVLKTTLPTTQTYSGNSFGEGAFPMAAVTSGTEDYCLKFKNILGGVKLQLTGSDVIRRIEFRGNNDETLCGAATIKVGNKTLPTMFLTSETEKVVTLDCGDEGVALDPQTPKVFVIALPPMTLEKGFTVTIYGVNGDKQEIATQRSQTIERSNLLKMPVVGVKLAGLPSDLRLVIANPDIKVGTYKDRADTAYIPKTISVVEGETGKVVYTYSDGTMIPSEYARQQYALDTVACTIAFKKDKGLSYPNASGFDSEASFGYCLDYFSDSNGLYVVWNNMGTDLQMTKVAQYNIVVTLASGLSFEGSGVVTVMSTAETAGRYEDPSKITLISYSVRNSTLYLSPGDTYTIEVRAEPLTATEQLVVNPSVVAPVALDVRHQSGSSYWYVTVTAIRNGHGVVYIESESGECSTLFYVEVSEQSTAFSGNLDLELGTYKARADLAYIPKYFQILDTADTTKVLYYYKDGAFIASDYAKSTYGYSNTTATVALHTGNELSYANTGADAKETFGGCLYWGSDSNGQYIAWNNLGTDLQVDKYAQYNVVVTTPTQTYLASGRVKVLSTEHTFESVKELSSMTCDAVLVLGTYKAKADTVFIPDTFNIVESDNPSTIVFTYKDGRLTSTDYALANYGISVNEAATVTLRERQELSYPNINGSDSQASFGWCLSWKSDYDSQYIIWDNHGTELQVDKYAQYNLTIKIPSCTYAVGGTLKVLSSEHTTQRAAR